MSTISSIKGGGNDDYDILSLKSISSPRNNLNDSNSTSKVNQMKNRINHYLDKSLISNDSGNKTSRLNFRK
jgi:hypothetical protein